MSLAETAARAALQLLRTPADSRAEYAQWLQERMRVTRLLSSVPAGQGEVAAAVRAAHTFLATESRTWIEAVAWAREYERIEKMLAGALGCLSTHEIA